MTGNICSKCGREGVVIFEDQYEKLYICVHNDEQTIPIDRRFLTPEPLAPWDLVS